MMICGNKATLGNSVMTGLTEGATHVLLDSEVQKLKQDGRLMLELWNE